MENEDRSAHKRDRKQVIAQFQKSLGKIVVLLLEIKNEPNVPQSTKTEIGRGVEELQAMIRELPFIGNSRNILKVVFRALKTIIAIWHGMNGD